MTRIEPRLEGRFWSFVDVGADDECWLWLGPKSGSGYGAFYPVSGKPYVLAHRVAYFLEHGDPGDLCVCHHCDTPLCCNPGHHFLGTRADNNRDMTEKGRQRSLRGEESPAAKLTLRDVVSIRQSTLPTSQLALIYKVSRSTIQRARDGKTWRAQAMAIQSSYYEEQ